MGNSINVLHVITDLDQGGAEMALLRLLKNQAKEIKADVLSIVGGGLLKDQFTSVCNVYELGLEYGKVNAGAIFKLLQLTRSKEWDLIQGWMYHGNIVASLAGVLNGNKPVLHGVRQCLYDNQTTSGLTKFVLWLNSILSGHAKAVLYNSSLSMQHHTKFGFDDENGQLWLNGYQLEEFSINPALGNEFKTSLGVPEDALVIGTLGRYHPMKDYLNALQAFSRLVETRHDVHLILAGKDLDSLNHELSKAVANCMIPESNIHLLGSLTETSAFYNSLDCFLLSSSSEAFPNVLLEAMAYEVPVASTAVGEVSSILDSYPFVCPPQDSLALFKSIHSLLLLPMDERKTLGKELRIRVQNRYSIEKCCEKIQNLYEKLIFSKDW